MRQEPENLLEQQCLEYFQDADIFRRLLGGFRNKYISYNTFAGTVVIKNLSAGDREALEGFLRRNYHGKNSASVSAELFAKALRDSKFSPVSPVRLLELYFHQPMVGKKEIQDRNQAEWKQMLGEAENYARQRGDEACRWFSCRQRELSLVHQPDERKISETKEELIAGMNMVQELPVFYDRYEYLAVFSARVTGDPHAFDPAKRMGRLLGQLVKWYAQEYASQNLEMQDEGTVFHSLQDQRQYLQAGIIRDDVSNYAMLYNVQAYHTDGRLHRGMEGFSGERQMVSVPLSVILQWDRVECPGNRIYIVENPTIFAILSAQNKEIALMCMNGQPRFSSLLVLDLMKKSDTEIFYSGDLDPEGILIASKLRRYYRENFHYWRMTLKDYRDSISSKPLSQKRLRILDRLEDEELHPVIEAMQQLKMAGYQENLTWEKKEYEIQSSNF